MPWQPSSPHCLPLHCRWQHAPALHTWPVVHAQSAGQLPQFSPAWQIPSPHPTHLPSAPQLSPPVQPVPHCPPQPSGPHCLFPHCGVQHVAPTVHTAGLVHPQSRAQLLQFSPLLHCPSPQTTCCRHWPFTSQMAPVPEHAPQVPPQPSGPHCFPPQLGTQHAPWKHVLPWQAQSVGQDEQSSRSVGLHTLSPHDAC